MNTILVYLFLSEVFSTTRNFSFKRGGFANETWGFFEITHGILKKLVFLNPPVFKKDKALSKIPKTIGFFWLCNGFDL